MNRAGSALFSLAILVALISASATAQTASQLEQKYARLSVYAVRPNISLTAKFGNAGRVCEMVFEPRRYDGGKIVLLSNLPQEETVAVIEEVVPESDRGRRLEGGGFNKWLKSDIGGGSITTTYRYDNMTIQFHGTIRREDSDSMVAVVTFPQRSCN
jgi:hypothetical protein